MNNSMTLKITSTFVGRCAVIRNGDVLSISVRFELPDEFHGGMENFNDGFYAMIF